MAYKFLQTSFQYLYKFEINSKISGNGSINVYDNSGNLLYSDTVASRGHTLYIFNKSLQLISKTSYDSYGEGNTNGITNEINKYIKYIGYMFAIVTCDAITHDSTFNDLMKLRGDKSFDLGKDISCYMDRNSFAFLGVNSHSQNIYVGYEHDCNFDYNVNKNSTLTSYIIKSKINKDDKPIVLTRNPKMYTRIYPYNNSTQPDTPFLKLKKDNLIYYAPNLHEHSSHSVTNAEGKIVFKKSDSDMLYALRDTLERYTYAELEHLKFLNGNYKFVNLDYMELYNY